jgi:hypothetical protein
MSFEIRIFLTFVLNSHHSFCNQICAFIALPLSSVQTAHEVTCLSCGLHRTIQRVAISVSNPIVKIKFSVKITWERHVTLHAVSYKAFPVTYRPHTHTHICSSLVYDTWFSFDLRTFLSSVIYDFSAAVNGYVVFSCVRSPRIVAAGYQLLW